jgi:hypothetical protein
MQQTRPYAEDVLINFGHRVSDPGVRALHKKLLPELKNGEAFDPSDRTRKYANIYYSSNAGRWRVKDSAGNLKNEVLALRHDDQTTSELTELENQRVLKYAENQAKNTPIPTRAASYDYETRVATHLYMDHNVGRGAHHLIMDTVRNNPNAIMANVLSNNGMHLHHKNNPGYFYRNGMPLTAQQVYDRYLQKVQEGLDYHDQVEISLQDKNDKIAQEEKKDSGQPEAGKADTKDKAATTADATDKLKDAFPDAASGQAQGQEGPIVVSSVALRDVPIPGIKPNS